MAHQNVFLLLGGNIGDRENFLRMAREQLANKAGSIKKASAIYQTAAWGVEDQQPYLNQVLQIETKFTAEELIAITQHIETTLGRTRQTRWEARVIDIDILFFDNQIITKPGIEIPHPRLHLRRFTLIPLAEIAPDFKHPALQKTVTDLLEICPDELEVKKLHSPM